MARYLVERAIGMVVVMFIAVTVVILIVRLAPGDPAAVMLGPDATPADIIALRHQWGLDQPLFVQYVQALGQIVRGDLGQSIFLNRPVLTAILERTEPTFLLAMLSLAIASLIAIPIGVFAAYKRGSLFDQGVVALAMLSASIPSFWLALLFIQFFSVRLGIVPVAGYGGPGANFLDRVHHLLLPAFTLGLLSSSLIIRFTRSSMLDVLNDDYIRTARSKGMGEFRVVMRHAFKNALIPIVTVLGLTVALLVSGAVVIETVFGLPGIGNLVVSAVLRRDYPVIQGALLVITGLYVLINFLIDVLYVIIDRRVRY
ncbi:MAG: peptide transporter [Hyphomicrobiales bacterium]|nr:peptide transporter [Hyphomicrobiales bacterium]